MQVLVRKRWECLPQRLRSRKGIFRFCDSTDHGNSLGTGFDNLLHIGQINSTNCEPDFFLGNRSRCIMEKVGADRFSSRFGRRSPDRANAKITEIRIGVRRIDLFGRVSREAENHLRSDHCASSNERQIVLTQMQNRTGGSYRQIRPVIDSPQLPMSLGRISQNFQNAELSSRFDAFISELNDVNSSGEGGIDELRKVALASPNIGAEVELR